MSGYEGFGASRQHPSGRIGHFLQATPWAAWLVLALSLMASILVWHFAHENARNMEEAEFHAKAYDIESRIRQRMLAHEQVLQGAAGLFAASQNVGREEWRAYVKHLDVDRFYPGILGIAYSARLRPDRKIRSEDTAFPPGSRAEYTPVRYAESFAGYDPHAFGYDMSSEPVRRAAMEQARDKGSAAITGKLELFREAGESPQAGAMLSLPIYRNGWPVTTVEQRRAALQGYVSSVFSMNALMAGILGVMPPDLKIELYDGAEAAPAAMLYDGEPGRWESPRFAASRVLNIADHEWLLTVESRPFAASGTAPGQPWILLAFGMAISLLLFALFRGITAGRTRAYALAGRMTDRSLESAEHYRKLFDEATVAIAVADAETGELIDLNSTMEQLSGWKKAELVGQSQRELHPPEHTGEAGAVTDAFARHRSDMEGQPIETRLLTKDGAIREVEIKSSLLVLDGRRVLMGFFRDITESRQYKQSLFNSKELLERIFANIRMLIAYMDADFNFIRVNPAYAAADGRNPDDFVGKNHFQLYPNRENEQIFRKVVASGRPYTVYAKPFIYEHNHERGITYWDWNVQPVKDQQGEVIGVVLSLLERTEEKRAEEKLRLYGRALEASDNSIAIVDATRPGLPLIYVNPAFTAITGYSAEEALGQNPGFLLGNDRRQPELESIRSAVREKRDGQAVLRNYRKDGSQFWNELYVSPVYADGGEVSHFIGVTRDITQRKNYEAELERMASFDTLTGLANRNLFQDRLSQAIVHAHRNSGLIAVVVLDLDGFKLVNDSLGHHTGDMLLREVAARLSACVRELDTVARLGGDEFVIAMPDLGKVEDAVIIADKLLKAISVSMRCDAQDLYSTASIGISLYPQDGGDAESLLKHAELAMYRAKEQGRNRYQYYAPEMNRRVADSLSLGNDLHRALERSEFTLHYQPQVDLKAGNIVGVEALLRWQHPKLGWVSPASFIPVAEECGLIVPLGNWVLQQACRAARAWHDQGYAIVVAVNLSARQIRERGFVQSVRDALLASGLDARYLELELTESILIEQADFVFEVLQQLREMGVELSLDDFGTGYSSLSYLKRFPISRLKIDQSFVRDIVSDPEDAAIVGAIISMAHNLKLRVIAEGVETVEQLAFLRLRHCDEMQGYYFSRPVPAADISAILQQGKKVELGGLADGAHQHGAKDAGLVSGA
jgi:diguanylate cyclase (GGDEF)-like protein/PAS domain S-box-containing protein